MQSFDASGALYILHEAGRMNGGALEKPTYTVLSD